MDCSTPIDAAILMDHWLALLSSSDEEAVEEHLLACDPCGDRLREVIALAEGLVDKVLVLCPSLTIEDGLRESSTRPTQLYQHTPAEQHARQAVARRSQRMRWWPVWQRKA